MDQQRLEYDLLIVGGGMVSAALVAALRHRCPGLSVAVIEAAEQFRSPSFDGRVTALALGSRILLERWGCWSALAPRVTAIQRVEVRDRSVEAKTNFSAAAQQVPALGYVIENRHLGEALWRAPAESDDVCLIPGRTVDRVRFLADGVQVDLPDRSLRAGLLVLADGGRSTLTEQLGLSAEQHDYQQSALVAGVQLRDAHQGRAFECFTDEGPLALLPLADHRMGLIWSMDHAQAQRRQQLEAPAFLAELQERFGDALGPLSSCSALSAYPLTQRCLLESVRSRLVVLGNAAHTLHPVAGQGFNLCLRDVDVLVDELQRGLMAGEPVGQLARLLRYQQRQQSDQHQTSLASDLLVRAFAHSSTARVGLRHLALQGLDQCGPLKGWLARRAMGLHHH